MVENHLFSNNFYTNENINLIATNAWQETRGNINSKLDNMPYNQIFGKGDHDLMQIFSSRVNSSVVRFDLHSMLTIDMYLEIATHLYECMTLVSKILTMLRENHKILGDRRLWTGVSKYLSCAVEEIFVFCTFWIAFCVY